jgi:hypothetical protein
MESKINAVPFCISFLKGVRPTWLIQWGKPLQDDTKKRYAADTQCTTPKVSPNGRPFLQPLWGSVEQRVLAVRFAGTAGNTQSPEARPSTQDTRHKPERPSLNNNLGPCHPGRNSKVVISNGYLPRLSRNAAQARSQPPQLRLASQTSISHLRWACHNNPGTVQHGNLEPWPN